MIAPHPAESGQKKGQPEQKQNARTPEQEATEELGRLVAESANDHALLVKNLEAFLKRYPDNPRKTQVYRALVEALLQLGESSRALEYAERLIALQPDDVSMMLLAVDLLEQAGDDRSILRAVGYAARVLDRVEKNPAGTGRPPGMAEAQWELEQKTMQMSVYIIRGRLLLRQRNYEKAAADFAASYAVLPNATSQLRLGEIAELRGEYTSAIQHYLSAFLMPVNYGAAVDRRDVRRKLGNVWRMVHGSEEGLGERMLAAYDELAGGSKQSPLVSVSDTFYKSSARLPGGAAYPIGNLEGSVVVVIYCANWSLPCRELLPNAEKAAAEFAQPAPDGKAETPVITMWVAQSEDELGAAGFESRKSRLVRLVSEDLPRVLKTEVIPTVVVLDGKGEARARWSGYAQENFPAKLKEAVAAARVAAN